MDDDIYYGYLFTTCTPAV